MDRGKGRISRQASEKNCVGRQRGKVERKKDSFHHTVHFVPKCSLFPTELTSLCTGPTATTTTTTTTRTTTQQQRTTTQDRSSSTATAVAPPQKKPAHPNPESRDIEFTSRQGEGERERGGREGCGLASWLLVITDSDAIGPPAVGQIDSTHQWETQPCIRCDSTLNGFFFCHAFMVGEGQTQ